MKAAEKNRQSLSSSETRTPNVKYRSKKWKISRAALEDYIHYMSDDGIDAIID